MHIYAINSINFTASAGGSGIKKIEKEKLGRIRNNSANRAKKDFYNNIDAYLNKKFTKKQFLENLNKFAHKFDGNKIKLNDAERQYLDDMLTTIDLSGKSTKIPDKYIVDNISELLKNQ